MLNELEFKAFLQKELNRTPDDDQMAVLREIARVAESNEALNYFRLGASAGSGKTTLILFAYFLLTKFCGIPSNQIVILTLNTRISNKINLSIRAIESSLSDIEFSDICAYTFHAFAMRFLRKASEFLATESCFAAISKDVALRNFRKIVRYAVIRCCPLRGIRYHKPFKKEFATSQTAFSFGT